MTFLLCAAIYVGFAVWGKPEDGFADLTEEPILTIRAASAATSYDKPTILADDQRLAEVSRTLAAAPDPSAIAAATPQAGFADPARIGEPVVVSLVHGSLLDDPLTPLTNEAVAVPQDGTDGRLMRVTGSRVNMRAGPSVADAVVDSLSQGTIAEVVGDATDGWIQIRDQSTGQVGFMSASFLEPA